MGSRVIRLAAFYFGAVFAAGYVLGILRTTFFVPLVGTRYAELIEIPFMLLIVYFVGRLISQRASSQRQAHGIGIVALGMLLSAEVLLAAMLFRKSPVEALFNKDPVSGTAYYLSLLVFAVLPGWLRGRTAAAKERN